MATGVLRADPATLPSAMAHRRGMVLLVDRGTLGGRIGNANSPAGLALHLKAAIRGRMAARAAALIVTRGIAAREIVAKATATRGARHKVVALGRMPVPTRGKIRPRAGPTYAQTTGLMAARVGKSSSMTKCAAIGC